MITSFEDAFHALMNNEGGYTVDAGGATRWGITERVARAHGYTGDMMELPMALAKQIAKSDYWDPYLCDQMDPNIAFIVMDAAYNGGRVAQWLQQAVNVNVDGKVGAATIAAVRAMDPLKVIVRFSAYHTRYLTALQGWEVSGKGWANRNANNFLTVTT